MARVPRFHNPGLPDHAGAVLGIEGEEAHHAISVLRLEPGAEVEVFDGRGGCGRFLVRDVARGRLALVLVARQDDGPETLPPVTLAVAVPRPKRLLVLVEKLTELGAAAFAPLETARARPASIRKEKLERRALEAAKQCGRNRVPEILTPLDLATLAALRASAGVDLAVFGETRGRGAPLRELLRRAPAPRSILLAVGPEGGFAKEEKAALVAAGFVAGSLGRGTLRVETAALALLASVVYELG